jgi:predicted amidohydrolase YtcJ
LGEAYLASIKESIRAVTIHAAWQMHQEDQIGSLEIGKKADFIIIDANPLEVDPDEISSISISEVYIDGVKIFQKQSK